MAVIDMGQQFVESDGEVAFPVAEAGIYEARIIGVEDHMSGNKSQHPGTPMWKVTFQITEGNHEGMKLRNYMTLPFGDGTDWMSDDDRSMRIDELKRLWMATGAPSEGGQIESDDLIHLSCRIDVGQRKDENDDKKIYNDVNDILPIV